jgi:hypothetical protein
MMAACASGMAIGFLTLQAGACELVELDASFCWLPDLFVDLAIFVPVFVGLAVLASWMTLVLGRRWRPDPGWVDRLGRAVGVFWVVTGFTCTVLAFAESTKGTCCTARSVKSTQAEAKN